MSGLPESLPGGEIVTLHLIVSSRIKNHVLIDHETGSKVERNQGPTSRLLAAPALLARPAIKTGYILSIMINQDVSGHREAQGRNLVLLFPEEFPTSGIIDPDAPRACVPDKLGPHPGLISHIALGNVVFQF